MIFSENAKPALSEFRQLMDSTDALLNQDAAQREQYYAQRNGSLLEQNVFEALCECSRGTVFQDSIQLVSGASFPDIVAHHFYGVEVKSTTKNHWTSIGSSILESTRIADVERIFLTFGKLGSPVTFLSRPYEECLSGIAVTHYPRYQIDMRLAPGETIFDKMGVSYDELRQMENPVAPVSAYYKKRLGPGERLWWAGENPDAAVPAKLRLWSTLSKSEKEHLIVQGYALFPELLANGAQVKDKYDNFALWLVAEHGIVNNHLRDGFSAGGQVDLPTMSGEMVRMPATFGRIQKHRELIIETVLSTPAPILRDSWKTYVSTSPLMRWCELAAAAADSSVGYDKARSVLYRILMPCEHG